jgi:hypothetical protein
MVVAAGGSEAGTGLSGCSEPAVRVGWCGVGWGRLEAGRSRLVLVGGAAVEVDRGAWASRLLAAEPAGDRRHSNISSQCVSHACRSGPPACSSPQAGSPPHLIVLVEVAYDRYALALVLVRVAAVHVQAQPYSP